MHLKNKKIIVTGGGGFIGSHVVDILINIRKVNPKNILIPKSNQLDFTKLDLVRKYIRGADVIFHLAADIGGVGYSIKHPATQYYRCSLLDLQILEAARLEKIKKIVMTSSACAYAANSPLPLSEKNLYLSRPPLSHDGYGMAKRMTCFLAEIYQREFGLNAVTIIPNNTYGPRDNFDYESGHVIPSLIRKCFSEKKLVIWGNGKPTRDFLYVEDFAEGMILAMEKLSENKPINLGSGKNISIANLVKLIIELTDFQGKIFYDKSKPIGQKERSVNINSAKKLIGFKPKFSIKQGLIKTIEWYKKYELNKK